MNVGLLSFGKKIIVGARNMGRKIVSHSQPTKDVIEISKFPFKASDNLAKMADSIVQYFEKSNVAQCQTFEDVTVYYLKPHNRLNFSKKVANDELQDMLFDVKTGTYSINHKRDNPNWLEDRNLGTPMYNSQSVTCAQQAHLNANILISTIAKAISEI